MSAYKTIILLCILVSFLPTTVLAVDITKADDDAIVLTINNTIKEYLPLSDITHFIYKTPFLVYDPHYDSEIEKTILCNDKTQPCLLTATTRRSFKLHHKTHITINTDKIKTFVDDIARKINTDPNNARLRFNSDTKIIEEITPHTDGITIDVEKTVTKITEFLEDDINNFPKTIELAYTYIPAEITSDNARDLGIVKLIGQGTSDFRGSTKSRIHNITTASKRFDGLVLRPNEEFSFVSILGPVDEEHGYKEELVIRDNETKPEYGGGICQVSTTVFRGAIYAGMKITQRHNHSYPVHYYIPTGFDATVYIPAPDLRFINNTSGHILLNMEIRSTELIFKYYGTDDERDVKMDGPHITDRQDNGAMKTYFTQIVKDKNGKTIIDDIFKSTYKSPDDYPHPDDVAKLTSKPDNWSKKQWKDYELQHGL